jgi:hypothetical protein
VATLVIGVLALARFSPAPVFSDGRTLGSRPHTPRLTAQEAKREAPAPKAAPDVILTNAAAASDIVRAENIASEAELGPEASTGSASRSLATFAFYPLVVLGIVAAAAWFTRRWINRNIPVPARLRD